MPIKRVDLDIEHLAVLACVLAPRDADLREAIQSADLSRTRLEKIAVMHQVRPQVARYLGSTAVEAVARANAGKSRLMMGELLRIAAALASAGITAAPYKGPAFAQRYMRDAGLRESTDLDFLVHPADRLQAAKIVQSLGFETDLPWHAVSHPLFEAATPELTFRRPADGLMVELHWRVAPAWFPAFCDLDDIWPRLTKQDLCGTALNWPAPEELLLIHLGDGLKSCGCGMKWIGDVVQVLRAYPGIDWRRVIATAARRGSLNALSAGIAVARDLCASLGAELDAPEFALPLDASVRGLDLDSAAVKGICRAVYRRLQADAAAPGALGHFRWALDLSDHPPETLLAIGRYLSGPAVADFSANQDSEGVLRTRALLRRCGIPLPGQARSFP